MFVHCCHCTDCQRQTGSAFVLNALIETDRVQVLQGDTRSFPQPTDSGRPHVIHRCADCGTALWSNYGGREQLRFIGALSLYREARIRTRRGTRCGGPSACRDERGDGERTRREMKLHLLVFSQHFLRRASRSKLFGS
jgi:hypothetical protein